MNSMESVTTDLCGRLRLGKFIAEKKYVTFQHDYRMPYGKPNSTSLQNTFCRSCQHSLRFGDVWGWGLR